MRLITGHESADYKAARVVQLALAPVSVPSVGSRRKVSSFFRNHLRSFEPEPTHVRGREPKATSPARA